MHRVLLGEHDAVSTSVLFQGYIADLRLFAGALSDTEISSLYASLIERTPAPTFSATPSPTSSPTLTLAYTATITTYASDLCVDTTAGGTVTYTGVGCGGRSILWTDAATSAADIRSGEGLSTSTCAWDWTTHSASAQAVYGGTCGVNPTINGGDQLPMSFAACAASATCAYTARRRADRVADRLGCYCAACGGRTTPATARARAVLRRDRAAPRWAARRYSAGQACDCATNTVISTRRLLLAPPSPTLTPVHRLMEEVGCNATTPAHMPGVLAELSPAAFGLRDMMKPFLRAMIAPFADVLSMPHVKFAGAGGEPLA